MPERQTRVLVAGGSLVGLSTSVLLAGYGVPHLVVESHQIGRASCRERV